MEASPSMSFPPEPWSLRGRMHVSVWALPVADVPALPAELAGAVRVLRLGGRAFVGTAWVDYQPGGDLSYHELLAAVLTRAGWRPRVTITHIWVDSVASRDGGRALWGIPKDLAEFDFPAHTAAGPAAAGTASTGPAAAGPAAAGPGVAGSGVAGTASAASADGLIASAVLPGGAGLPPRLPVRFRVVQALAGRSRTTPVRSTARYGPARVTWTVAPDGPLRFLAGRRPLLSFVVAGFRMRFGAAQAGASRTGA